MKEMLKITPDFWQQNRKIYYIADKGEVGGYYRQTGNFTFITVPKSGHFMPANNYDAAKSILDDYVLFGALQNGSDTAEEMCGFMKGCGRTGKCNSFG